MAQQATPDSPATIQDIQTRKGTLIADINSGSIDKVRTDMIDDAKKYGSVKAQEIFRDASRNANVVKLGFPSGSFLTGVSGENVVAQTSGDPQHPKFQQRSTHGDVQTPVASTAGTDLGTRGHSQMVVNADGSGTVTREGNDVLWTIAQKIVEQRQGRATQTDIGNLVNQITAHNRQTNPNFNPDNPPKQFEVPPQVRGETGLQAPTAYDPARPGTRMATTDVAPTVVPGSPAATATGDLTAPIAPPGLAAAPGAVYDNDKGWRTQNGQPTTDKDGNVTRTYDGGLYDGNFGMFRTHFNGATETVDSHGNLLNSHVEYTRSGPSMTIKPDNQPQQTIENVRSVDVQYNPGTGRYTSTYTRANGERIVTSTDRQGHVAMGPGANAPGA